MNKKRAFIYTIGLLQGLVLVSFPAASTILTNSQDYGFTNTQYGSLFIPQAIFAIITALLNSLFCKHFTAHRTLAIGLGSNFLSMLLLTLSTLTMDHRELTYGILLLATSFLGIGFGIVVPTINRMTVQLSPKASDQAVLTLNALLGIGTTLAPAFVAFFSFIGFWWGLPLCLTLAFLTLFLGNLKINLPEEQSIKTSRSKSVGSWGLLYLFILFAFLYGIIETINGTWISIYMRTELHASMNIQSLALATFWGMVTFGRFFSARISKFLSQQMAFRIAPFIATLAFLILSSHLLNQTYEYIIAFGLMGLGCSVILPLLISFGGNQLTNMAASVPGMIISVYLLGYGVAAFGVGPLKEFGYVNLRDIYTLGACISLVLGLASFYLTHRRT